MNELPTFSSSGGASERGLGARDPDRLVVPAGLLGPVYRVDGDAEALRAQWIRTVTWSVVVPVAALVATTLIAVDAQPRLAGWTPFEDPAWIFGLFALALICKWAAGLLWARRHGDVLESVDWASADLDTRLDATFAHMRVDRLRRHLVVTTTLMIPFLLISVALTVADSFSLLLGIVLVSLLASTAHAFRVYQLRARRERGCASPERSP